mmetsp:Transcript_21441/g.54595  ORF Transcript_21441/g.54595 Transcript_21441/m.54595 type:complete len:328 (-) Transcript_21441:97-1080(-)
MNGKAGRLTCPATRCLLPPQMGHTHPGRQAGSQTRSMALVLGPGTGSSQHLEQGEVVMAGQARSPRRSGTSHMRPAARGRVEVAQRPSLLPACSQYRRWWRSAAVAAMAAARATPTLAHMPLPTPSTPCGHSCAALPVWVSRARSSAAPATARSYRAAWTARPLRSSCLTCASEVRSRPCSTSGGCMSTWGGRARRGWWRRGCSGLGSSPTQGRSSWPCLTRVTPCQPGVLWGRRSGRGCAPRCAACTRRACCTATCGAPTVCAEPAGRGSSWWTLSGRSSWRSRGVGTPPGWRPRRHWSWRRWTRCDVALWCHTRAWWCALWVHAV